MIAKMNNSNGIDIDFTRILEADPYSLEDEARAARRAIESREGVEQYCGWLDLPTAATDAFVEKVLRAAETIRKADSLVVTAIGGSYLGSRSLIEAIQSPYEQSFPILFAGYQVDPDHHAGLLRRLKQSKYAINVISKSGTTIEVLIAFRILWNDLKSKFSKEEIKDLVFVTTGSQESALGDLCRENDLQSFEIGADVPGRFSVLSSVGLLPIAAAGLDIRALLKGAREMMEVVRDPANDSADSNPALAYAAFRNAAYRAGRKVEVLATSVARLGRTAEWWKQLFGESEGKAGKGMFPASVGFTTDLHSLGQWLQEGENIAFETLLEVRESSDLSIPSLGAFDDLGPLSGKSMHEVNRAAIEAALTAHSTAGMPCIRISIPRTDEATMGALLYLFEYSCAISATMLGVNPFDQPGVAVYKRSLNDLLKGQ